MPVQAGAGVRDTDLRPTGPRQLAKAAENYQERLDQALGAADSPALREWAPLLNQIGITGDPFTPTLAEHLATISRAGINVTNLVTRCAAARPLPDDYPSAALWWRIHHHLPTATKDQFATPARHPEDALRTTATRSEANPHDIAELAARIDPRLPSEPDWGALNQLLHTAQAHGHDLPTLLRGLADWTVPGFVDSQMVGDFFPGS